MSKALVLKIKGKDTIIKCLQPDNSSAYIDSITKAFDYVNVSQKSIIVKNICDTSFILPAQDLFTQNDSLGSTFEASIGDTLIGAQSAVNVPVYYNGIYNGSSNNPTYNFMLNGVPISYQLLINVPDTVGTITDIVIDLGNRVNYTFLPTDFTSHHNDPDGDTIVSVFLFGFVNTIQFDGNPYVANTPVTMQDVQLGKLKHNAPDIDPYNSVTGLYYKVEDNLGNIIE